MAGIASCFVPGRNPRAAFDQVVQTVKCGRREIIVARVNAEAFKPRDRRLRPLPNVANDVVEIAKRELRHWATRGIVLQVDVAWSGLPIGLIRVYGTVAQMVPLLFRRKPNRLVSLGALSTIRPGIGATFFGGVVVITMIAAHCFDPRLIWDNLERTE